MINFINSITDQQIYMIMAAIVIFVLIPLVVWLAKVLSDVDKIKTHRDGTMWKNGKFINRFDDGRSHSMIGHR